MKGMKSIHNFLDLCYQTSKDKFLQISILKDLIKQQMMLFP